MDFTGERVVPHDMHEKADVYSEHLIRYAFATQYCATKEVLDVACGTGYGMKIIEPISVSIHGGDIDMESIKYAQYMYGLRNIRRIDLSSQTILEVFKKKFDVIISFETIEHIQNYEFFIRNVRQALSPNGYFIFSVPVANESKFHKRVFTYKGACKVGKKYFKEHATYIQTANMIISKKLIKKDMNYRGVYVVRIMR